MDGRSGGPTPKKPQNLRSSVSMFIEDSRITAVANAEPPIRPSYPPTSFYSVTSFTSSSSTTSPRAAWRPAFCPISTTLPEQSLTQRVSRPRACSSSPVRFPRRAASSGSREIIHNIIREVSEEPPISHSPPFIESPRVAAPPPSPSTVRRRTTLSVEPVISVINVREGLPPLPNRGFREDRAYTSVNLTLRSPSNSCGVSGPTLITSSSTSGGGGGAHISDIGVGACGVNVVNTVVDMEAGGTTFRHIHSSTGGGGATGTYTHHPTNLMYSTYSNSRDGFEAQVQIQFGPSGGTFTASRRRNHNISIRQMNSDLLTAQTDRKDKLRTAIQDRRRLLAKLQAEIVQLRSQLQLRSPFSDQLEKLKQENQRLRIQCDFMAREVDLYQNGSVPLGETDEEFYQGINPGQSVDALFGITNNRRRLGGSGRGGPPPRPPPPKFLPSPGRDAGEMGGGAEEGEWRCSMCTFQNHRDLDFCEQCQMVRVKHPHTPQSHSHLHHLHQQHHGPSREQNIRIRVVRHGQQRHYQHPAPPQMESDWGDEEQETTAPRQRRVVHSWVM